MRSDCSSALPPLVRKGNKGCLSRIERDHQHLDPCLTGTGLLPNQSMCPWTLKRVPWVWWETKFIKVNLFSAGNWELLFFKGPNFASQLFISAFAGQCDKTGTVIKRFWGFFRGFFGFGLEVG